MEQLFIELYNYKPFWLELSESERSAFTDQVTQAVAGVEGMGVEVVGFGCNSTATDKRANYDFFCIYKVPSEEFTREFERQINGSGWYNYFEQVNISGDIQTPTELFSANVKLEHSN